jgi:hypothetical protein
MNSQGCDPESESDRLGISDKEHEDSEDQSDSGQATIGSDRAMDTRRDEISKLMWDDYQAYQTG